MSQTFAWDFSHW